ncbi:hypothetical protein WJ56_09810 [Burkholderia ubonensis]|nr:hypothetical protein WJ51_25745 [Burkholderia ubonensis]KVM07844.1 hypothetical protein WJ52_26780 [Burkholderia ubonensis]KVM53268.1 hypothetical protein WJ56_09810 [Burkholderia ubonensis]
MNMTEVAQVIRGGLIQQDRLLKTSIPSLPENALVPRRAVTNSEFGRPGESDWIGRHLITRVNVIGHDEPMRISFLVLTPETE